MSLFNSKDLADIQQAYNQSKKNESDEKTKKIKEEELKGTILNIFRDYARETVKEAEKMNLTIKMSSDSRLFGKIKGVHLRKRHDGNWYPWLFVDVNGGLFNARIDYQRVNDNTFVNDRHLFGEIADILDFNPYHFVEQGDIVEKTKARAKQYFKQQLELMASDRAKDGNR